MLARSCLRDPRAVVAHADDDGGLGLDDRDLDGPAVRERVLERVVEQVARTFADLGRGRCAGPARQGPRAILTPGGCSRTTSTASRSSGTRSWRSSLSPRPSRRRSSSSSSPTIVSISATSATSRRCESPSGSERERHLHARERRAQLVADVEQQLVAGADHLPHAADHPVEGVRQVAELVARPGPDRDVEIAAPERRDAVVERAQGAQGAPQEDVGREDHDRPAGAAAARAAGREPPRRSGRTPRPRGRRRRRGARRRSTRVRTACGGRRRRGPSGGPRRSRAGASLVAHEPSWPS